MHSQPCLFETSHQSHNTIIPQHLNQSQPQITHTPKHNHTHTSPDQSHIIEWQTISTNNSQTSKTISQKSTSTHTHKTIHTLTQINTIVHTLFMSPQRIPLTDNNDTEESMWTNSIAEYFQKSADLHTLTQREQQHWPNIQHIHIMLTDNVWTGSFSSLLNSISVSVPSQPTNTHWPCSTGYHQHSIRSHLHYTTTPTIIHKFTHPQFDHTFKLTLYNHHQLVTHTHTHTHTRKLTQKINNPTNNTYSLSIHDQWHTEHKHPPPQNEHICTNKSLFPSISIHPSYLRQSTIPSSKTQPNQIYIIQQHRKIPNYHSSPIAHTNLNPNH